MIPAFAHPCLIVPNLEKAGQFYQAMFGFKAMSRKSEKTSPDNGGGSGSQTPAHRSCVMKGHNCFLELMEDPKCTIAKAMVHFRDLDETGMHHLAFYVDDCWAGYKRFLALGGTMMGIPTGDSEQGYSVYCRDPFGNITELVEIPKQADASHTSAKTRSLVR